MSGDSTVAPPNTASAATAAKLDARCVQRALGYLAALQGGDARRAAQAQRESAHWRQRHPAHEAAWLDALRRWDAVQQLSPRLRETLAPAQGRIDPSRRRALKAAGGAGLCAGLAGWFGLSLWRAPNYETQATTGVKQHLDGLALPDGSTLDLAAGSALKVAFWGDRREVRLTHGRVRFNVTRDAARPFAVLTRLGRIDVLGTAFTVADRGHGLHVAVERGQVRLSSAAVASALRAGEQGGVSSEGFMSPVLVVSQSRDAADNGWRNGWWTFIDTPLAEAVAEVNAYLSDPLTVAADAAGLRLTGSFRIASPQHFIDSLPQVLPVRVTGTDPRRRIERRH